ncbi:hypothetical protein SAMN02745220_01590 [Desulfopila aestuarii DSM 18488]|uniref:Sulfotransferase family protein n=2 Tax=Desulfopila aestuarii TaxID=231440 RepID=A0A1M7Y3H3_9BACT|nr:hypothetical protein SAMN02745220_01590 [Desulfopila aestuarii DSM 18488]
MERGDFNILHEPFSYLYYVKGEDATIGQQYVDPDHPTDYQGIREHILQAGAEKPVFFKDMCAHCHTQLAEDKNFLARLTNTFLIRDPAKTIASFYAMNPKVTADEIGLEQLAQIFQAVAAQNGEPPIVVDAEDLEDNPNETINAYCQRLGIPFIPEAMTWEATHKKEWDIWKDWHRDAAQSTGIVKNMEKFQETVDNNEHLRGYYEKLVPFYNEMYAHKLTPVAP